MKITNDLSLSLQEFIISIVKDCAKYKPISYRDSSPDVQNLQIRNFRNRQFIAEFDCGRVVRAIGLVDFVYEVLLCAKSGKTLKAEKIFTSYCYNYLLRHATVEVELEEVKEVEPKKEVKKAVAKVKPAKPVKSKAAK